MHPQRKFHCQGAGDTGPEPSITPEEHERQLRSIDSDLESLLLEVDAEQSELERLLESVEAGADAASLAGLEEDLQATVALKAWICSKRAEVAERLVEGA
ncbi:MAG TPA: hypothetical protein VIH47_08295 [Solirubrobacterales bacterium]